MAAKKKKTESLVSVTDPKAPLDGAAFLAAAQKTLKLLADDLLARVDGSPAITEGLKARWELEQKERRTGDAFEPWRRRFVVQVGVAWILGCVFARTLEDRGLVDRNRIAGPGASDSVRQYLDLAPHLTEREYLLTVFRELANIPAARDLFDARHNPVWKLAPSAEGAKALMDLFRAPEADAPAFRFGQSDTRFLGDLYQDLSDEVRERFALLQTPRFVESFILDQTLEPAITEFGLDQATIIDPTCGSGHFLLGAFERLLDHRLRVQPGLTVREAALKALDAVHGADINPYAVAIARFRLVLAFLERGAYSQLAEAPSLPIHVVVGDSLLHGVGTTLQEDFAHAIAGSENAWAGELFALDNPTEAVGVLRSRYAAVVGNPPYITVKDPAAREVYRALYVSAYNQYSLAAPFAERFFELARAGGFVGTITSNSFMKREFGRKLVEEVLPKLDLHLIANTAGAFIPGHGTPTVLLFGRHRAPTSESVKAILGKRGDPQSPENAADGHVWRSIADHVDDSDFENDFVSFTNLARSILAKHPWSLGGGGASELKELLDSLSSIRLQDVVDAVGYSVITGEDNVLMSSRDALERAGLDKRHMRRNVVGEELRDWMTSDGEWCIWPNNDDGVRRPESELGDVLKHLWPYRTTLRARKAFGTPVEEKGIPWWALREVYTARMRTPLTIAFAEVATHNHFVLDRGGKVFKQTAPIIKLPAGASEDDHLALLAYLNSSLACFWLKQVAFDKGNRGEGGGLTSEDWEKFYQFDGTKVRALPIFALTPQERIELVQRARLLDGLGRERVRLIETFELSGAESDWQHLESALHSQVLSLESRIRFEQEALDWWWYAKLGFADGSTVPPSGGRLAPGERVSDVAFAMQVCAGKVGRRYFELCRLPAPEEVSRLSLSELASKQWKAVHSSAQLAMLEQPVYKRTFREGFRAVDARRTRQQARARLAESRFGGGAVTPLTARRLGASNTDPDIIHVLDDAAVPYASAYTFSASGMEIYRAWEMCWAAQRAEDGGTPLPIGSVPPKFGQGDYASSAVWRARGRLNVAKERFISYPGCESDEDKSPVYGWAGWNHLQRAQALSTLYQTRKRDEGWGKERLTPMLAGLQELVPWLKQWHNEPDESFGGTRLGDFFADFVASECQALGLTLDDLRNWRPAAKTRAAKPKANGDAPKKKTSRKKKADGDDDDASLEDQAE